MSRSVPGFLRGAVVVCLASSALFVGCSRNDRIATTPVAGSVLGQDGKPLERAIVIFHPTDTSVKFPKPRGTTDAEGKFQLSTYDTSDGAPVGKYKVTIEQWFRDNPDQAPTNHLPPNLASESSSGIEIQLTKGPNVLGPFKVL